MCRKNIKNSRIKRVVLSFAVIICTLFTYNQIVKAEEIDSEVNSADVIETTEKIFNSVNKKSWNEYLDLVFEEDKAFYRYYFSDDTLNEGIKQIDNVNILDIIQTDEDVIEESFYTEHPELEDKQLTNVIVEADCKVSVENQYFINGINYIDIIYVDENGFKVCQMNRASTDAVEKYIKPILDDNDGNYKAEVQAIKALESSNAGLLINNDGDYITNGFTVKRDRVSSDNILDAYPLLNHYVTYSYPQYIRVKLNTANRIDRVDLTTFMRCSLPNEWMASWHYEALKAGAYCVKMVGIYSAITPLDSAKGFDLTTGTQNYKPGESHPITDKVISDITNCGMANSAGLLFFPEQAKGEKGKIGPKASGQIKHYGSEELAKQGKTCKEILNYYYSGSIYSKGDVNLFGYNIGY